jgi:signal transduction histidine kinase
LTAKQREYIGYILQSGNHLLKLVNDVLDLSGVEAGRLKLSIEPLGVRESLETVYGSLAPLAAKAGIRVTLNLPDRIADVHADALRLNQVLINLVSNAIKYNCPGGTVTISAEEAGGGKVRIAVADTGKGIALNRQGEVFQPFRRLGAEQSGIEGTGIGLALARKLIEAMNGTIGFASVPDQGSTFWIELPLEGTSATQREASKNLALGGTGH